MGCDAVHGEFSGGVRARSSGAQCDRRRAEDTAFHGGRQAVAISREGCARRSPNASRLAEAPPGGVHSPGRRNDSRPSMAETNHVTRVDEPGREALTGTGTEVVTVGSVEASTAAPLAGVPLLQRIYPFLVPRQNYNGWKMNNTRDTWGDVLRSPAWCTRRGEAFHSSVLLCLARTAPRASSPAHTEKGSPRTPCDDGRAGD